MSIERVKQYFAQYGIEDKILVFEVSSATVELAAQALNCEPERIAKSLSFILKRQDKAILIVTAGDARIDNIKFKARFGEKARMLSANEVLSIIGHDVGGVCPFGINDDVDVYLDISLKRFETVYPACGSGNSAIQLSLPELEKYSQAIEWIDVCKI